MTPPMPIPIAPPTRVSPSHTSMLRSATDALLGPSPRGDVLFAVRTDGTYRAVTAASADPVSMGRLAELAGTWLPSVVGPEPLLAPVTRLPEPAGD